MDTFGKGDARAPILKSLEPLTSHLKEPSERSQLEFESAAMLIERLIAAYQDDASFKSGNNPLERRSRMSIKQAMDRAAEKTFPGWTRREITETLADDLKKHEAFISLPFWEQVYHDLCEQYVERPSTSRLAT